MAIRFFIEYKGLIAQLPVNPENLQVQSSGNNKTLEIVKLGEINQIKDSKLKTINIQCFLPANNDYPFIVTKGQFEGPKFYIDLFEKIRKEKEPCRLVISDTSINMLASIENFNHEQKYSDDDIYYTLSFKEFIIAKARTVKIEKPKTDGEKPKAVAKKEDRPKTGFSVGDIVVVNGRYYYTSYGKQPSNVFNNYTGKISHIVGDTKRAYRYHITSLSGGWMGWVTESQLSHK